MGTGGRKVVDLKNSLNALLPVARSVLGLDPASLGGIVPMDLTILFTDIENYAGAVDALGDRRSLKLVHIHNRVVREALADHGGHEIKHTGDGIMAWFPSASRALATAVELQAKTAAHNAAAAKNREQDHACEQLRIRVGLNTGEPIREDGDLYGTPVIIAARVADLASGGQILVTDVVRLLAAGKGFRFRSTGATHLQGISEPVALFEVDWHASTEAAAELA